MPIILIVYYVASQPADACHSPDLVPGFPIETFEVAFGQERGGDYGPLKSAVEAVDETVREFQAQGRYPLQLWMRLRFDCARMPTLSPSALSEGGWMCI